jgi:hypothetical protein
MGFLQELKGTGKSCAWGGAKIYTKKILMGLYDFESVLFFKNKIKNVLSFMWEKGLHLDPSPIHKELMMFLTLYVCIKRL